MPPSSFYKHRIFRDSWHQAEVGDSPRLRLLPNRMPEIEAILGRKLLLSRSRAALDPVRFSRLHQIVVWAMCRIMQRPEDINTLTPLRMLDLSGFFGSSRQCLILASLVSSPMATSSRTQPLRIAETSLMAPPTPVPLPAMVPLPPGSEQGVSPPTPPLGSEQVVKPSTPPFCVSPEPQLQTAPEPELEPIQVLADYIVTEHHIDQESNSDADASGTSHPLSIVVPGSLQPPLQQHPYPAFLSNASDEAIDSFFGNLDISTDIQYSAFGMRHSDICTEVPIVLLCHHAGHCMYRLVLDSFLHGRVRKQRVQMTSFYCGRYHKTPYHGGWRRDHCGNLHIVLRWCATVSNVGTLPLLYLDLRLVDTVPGLYTSTGGRVVATQLYASNNYSPLLEAARRFVELIDQTI